MLFGKDQPLVPYHLLGDEIGPLKKILMRPYPGLNATEGERIYIYRHSRGHRVIENSFGILSARLRILYKPIRCSVENVGKYILACLNPSHLSYSPLGFIDSEDSGSNILV